MGDTADGTVSIDWTSAEVRSGRLCVPVTGEPSADWAERVGAVADRLSPPQPNWGQVEVTDSQIVVTDVSAGCEDALAHILEGAVLQANAALAADTDEDADGPDHEADDAMTRAFRACTDPSRGAP